jgi:hypothetical protein
MNCSCLSLVLLVALICCETATAALYSNSEARQKLLQEAVGSANLTVSDLRVTTKRSQLLNSQQEFLSNSSLDSGTQQRDDLEAELEHNRSRTGLKIHFYYRLDSSRTAAEVDYIKNKLMPSTATVLARSIRVCSCTCSPFAFRSRALQAAIVHDCMFMYAHSCGHFRQYARLTSDYASCFSFTFT